MRIWARRMDSHQEHQSDFVTCLHILKYYLHALDFFAHKAGICHIRHETHFAVRDHLEIKAGKIRQFQIYRNNHAYPIAPLVNILML